MGNDHDELSARNDARSEEYLGKRIEDLLADRMALRKRVDALEAALGQAIGYLEHFTAYPDYNEEDEEYAIIVDGDIEAFKATLGANAEGK